MATDLKPGLYRLTKSFKNPWYGEITHRDLMGVIRVLPEGWDWLVHHKNQRERLGHPEKSPFMVMAAGGHWCQSMYVHEADHKTAMEDWSEEHSDIPPLLAPPEFLAALEPREPDTFVRVQQLHKFTGMAKDYKFDEVIQHLIDAGKLQAADLLAAMNYVNEHEDEPREALLRRADDEELYSAAVNEVFNETGEHWID